MNYCPLFLFFSYNSKEFLFWALWIIARYFYSLVIILKSFYFGHYELLPSIFILLKLKQSILYYLYEFQFLKNFFIYKLYYFYLLIILRFININLICFYFIIFFYMVMAFSSRIISHIRFYYSIEFEAIDFMFIIWFSILEEFYLQIILFLFIIYYSLISI